MVSLASFPALLLIIILPFLSIIPISIIKKKEAYKISIFFSFLVLLLTLFVVYQTKAFAAPSFSTAYIPYLNLNFGMQITQLNLILLVMTSIVFFAASIVGGYFIKTEERQYNAIFAIAEGACLALFLSSNLFLFYIFWEIAEIMMFFIIFIYGGYGRRYAAMKFIIFSLASSLLLLIGIMVIYASVTPHTFDILTIIKDASTIPQTMQLLAMVLLLFSFIIKMPVFPFHSWLPDAHTEAPTTGSMVLAGVLLKFGGYGLILMFLMLPIAANYSTYIAALFVFSAVYGAFVAFKQTNIKRAIAYTSITDMAIVAIGVAASNTYGTGGALYAMLSHGIVISLLFLIAGALGDIYGTLEMEKIKGVIRSFPSLAYFFIFGVVAMIGLPLTSGFVGDLLIFIGSFKAFGVVGLTPLVGILLLGALFFWIIEKVFLPVKESRQRSVHETAVLVSASFLVASTIILGIIPFVFLNS